LEKNSALSLPLSELSRADDVYIAIEAEVRKHWSSVRDFDLDQQLFDAICMVVAGALNPRPGQRPTPRFMLEKLEVAGKN
jgi:hypothetical protein